MYSSQYLDWLNGYLLTASHIYYQRFLKKRHISRWAKVIPLFKKAGPFDKTNYRPVSFTSYISKVFERTICNQITEYIEPILCKLLTGSCKNHNTYFLLEMLEKFKEALDKVNSVSAIFMDLSKSSDTINHDLLIAKCEAYGFSAKSILQT